MLNPPKNSRNTHTLNQIFLKLIKETNNPLLNFRELLKGYLLQKTIFCLIVALNAKGTNFSAMVLCSRFIWIINSRDHRRVWICDPNKRICDPNKSWARHHCSLKLGSKLKYLKRTNFCIWRKNNVSFSIR